MKNLKTLASTVLSLFFLSQAMFSSSLIAGGMDDDPIIGKLMIDQFETRVTNGDNPLVLEAQAWIGQDLNKLWVKIDSEWVGGDNEELEVQALYSRAIAPYWDFQIGWRHDSKPKPSKNSLAIGLQGVAPYWFEVDTTLYIGESGQVNAILSAEYEWMINQQLVLSPEVSINFHTKNDQEHGVGSGLSDTQIGLRLRYEIKREFAPYIGVNWIQKYGNSADYARHEGEDSSDVQFVVGLRAWF